MRLVEQAVALLGLGLNFDASRREDVPDHPTIFMSLRTRSEIVGFEDDAAIPGTRDADADDLEVDGDA